MGILDIFKRKKTEVTEELSLDWMEVDMHSHLIPGIDDGSKSLEESIELIKRLKGYGLKKLVTTPHIMSEFYKNTPEIIQLGLQDLNLGLEKAGVDIEVRAAAEYYLDEIFLEKVQQGEKLLTIHDNLVLVETGFINKPQMLLEIFFAMEMNGYKPVFAHPERYQYLIQDKKLLSDLFDREIYFQINLLSLTGFYSKPVKLFAEMLVDENRVKFFGTDCHNHRYLDMLESLPATKYFDKIRQLEILNKKL
ncbi:tyrosine-protein phosphatase [Arthrospiribacter ruber]|uniref:protein-tyrosine-phosphatase n=1 Tax=Arthrospiribacter ruber TaxID=2487934 RepID=A0A951IYL5_9BACT|nr:CpsB/CapC family capsule biosynthesis tyrosine phosphatase [Arthrospiribacter ruber]MBW3469198.1 capsular biosynthesis protein [Arthrospiribacter ruber]